MANQPGALTITNLRDHAVKLGSLADAITDTATADARTHYDAVSLISPSPSGSKAGPK